MKIKVEIDVSPAELPLATELIAVLRSITDQVTVNSTGGTEVAHVAQAPLSASLPPVPAAAAAPSAPIAGDDLKAAFADMLHAAEFSEHPEQIMEQIEALAWAPSSGLPALQRKTHPAFQAFVSAWQELALDPKFLEGGGSAVPFAVVLATAGNEFKAGVRDSIIPPLLKHLTKKRTLDAQRSEFFLHAEAFAGMASVGVVPPEGAISTLCKLLREPEKRAAAVTCLGKLVELAAYKLADTVSANSLKSLESTVASIKDEEFQYDISYIQQSMGWGYASAGGVTDATAQTAAAINGDAATSASAATTMYSPNFGLQALASLSGHANIIMALAENHSRRSIFSSGRDAQLLLWAEDGRQIQNIDTQGWVFNSIDYHPTLDRLFVVGCRAGAATPGPYCLGMVSPQPIAGVAGEIWTMQTPLVRDRTASLLVRCLPGTNGIITAESEVLSDNSVRPVVQYWDAGSLTAPAATFVGHPDPVTCLAILPERGTGAFASGGKDGTVLLWDLRAPQGPMASLGNLPSANGLSPAPAAGGLITTLAAADNLLLVGSADRTVRVFDLRRLAQGTSEAAAPVATLSTNNEVCMRVAVAPGSQTAVVACNPHMFALNLAAAGDLRLRPLEPTWADGRVVSGYLDARWNAEGSVLFAAGHGKTLDIFSVVG